MPRELRVPAKSFVPPKNLEIRPNQVKAWLESLPLAPTGDSGRELADYLAAFNGSKLDLAERLQILEFCRPIARALLQQLGDIYGRSPQPLNTDAREALTLTRALAAELAASYKIAIVDSALERTARDLGKPLAPLLLRAMQYLAEGMRASYRTYSRVPDGAWKEMHELYLYAEQEGVTAGAADAESNASVAEVYCESLLLSLCDPYRLLPDELEKIVGLMRMLRVPVTLGKDRPETRASAHFVVPCDEDKPPRSARLADDRTGSSNWRLLDANPLVDRLRAIKREADAGDASSAMRKMVGAEGLALIAKLIGLWDDPPKRAFRRDPAQGSVAICVGVKPIAQFVAHDATADGEAEAKALREGITMPLRALPEDESGHVVPIHEWAVINLSAGGLKVRRKASTAYPIAVGEVVGIRAAGKALWMIGVARWITALDDGTTEFGVQFFANAVCAVWVKITSSSSAPKLGVLLTNGEEVPRESLLTPPAAYSELGEFELRGEGFRSRVRASDLMEKNARFELFHVVPS
ncbi:MAG: hypothetical protein ACXWHC_18630 [Usitatibacter sp.]